MNAEKEPITADEFVLRRIHKSQCNASLVPPILPLGFRPGKEDTDGLSVYREKEISPAQLAAAGRKPGEYYVVRLSVQALHQLGLTLKTADPADGPPGHAVIPELNQKAYQQDKHRLQDIQLQLALLASQAIVHTPDS
jgi:hypothetical protein